MRVTSLELHQKLGLMIDKARAEPVVVTKHDRDHVVIVSAERFAQMEQALRRPRPTGSLTAKERAAAKAAKVPSEGRAEALSGEACHGHRRSQTVTLPSPQPKS